MAAGNIWKALLTLLLTLKSVREFNCRSNMSFIKVDKTSDFSFHNLPYGVFSTPDNVSEKCFSNFCTIKLYEVINR